MEIFHVVTLAESIVEAGEKVFTAHTLGEADQDINITVCVDGWFGCGRQHG